MLQVIDCEQNSEQWYAARVGVITASNFGAVLAKGEGKTRREYMLKLATERILGEAGSNFSNFHTQRGHEQEPMARELYVQYTGNEIMHCGFMLDIFGYSPDGLIGDDGTWEGKSKLPHIQADILLKDKIPNEYIAQCQGGLMVSNRKWCDFTSYCPGLPLFIKRVERDDKYIDNLKIELHKFEAELQTVIAQIMEKF